MCDTLEIPKKADLENETGENDALKASVDEESKNILQNVTDEETANPVQKTEDEPSESQKTESEPSESQKKEEEQQEGEQPIEAIRESTLKMIENTQGRRDEKKENQEGEEGAEAFDDLPIKLESDSEITNDAEAQQLKKQIRELREGNLYQAVIVLKRFQSGKSNPLASGRLARVLNSSKWSTVSEWNAGVTGGVGVMSTLIGGEYGKLQTAMQGVTLVTNLVTTVNSLRNSLLKVIKLVKGGTTWGEKTLLILGILGDLSMALAKSVAIAKTIEKWSGTKFPGLKQVSNLMFFATGSSQAIALINLCNNISKTNTLVKEIKKEKEESWKVVRSIVANHTEGITFAQMEEWDDDEREEKAESTLEALRNKEAGEGESEKERQKEIDLLVRYLGLSKRLSKKKRDEAVAITSAVNTAVGFCSSIITGGTVITSIGASGTKQKDWITANKAMGYTSKAAGLVASGTTLGATIVKAGIKGTSVKDERSGAAESRMLEKLESLGKNRYGLKHLEQTLIARSNLAPPDQEEAKQLQENATKEIKEDAKSAIDTYGSTAGLLKSMGVPVPQLIKAKDEAAYKKILLSDLV